MIEIVKTNNEDSIDTFQARLSSQRFARSFLGFKGFADSKLQGTSGRSVQITAAKVNRMAEKIYAWCFSDSQEAFNNKMQALHFSFDLIKDNFDESSPKRVSFVSLTSSASKLLSFAEGK